MAQPVSIAQWQVQRCAIMDGSTLALPLPALFLKGLPYRQVQREPRDALCELADMPSVISVGPSSSNQRSNLAAPLVASDATRLPANRTGRDVATPTTPLVAISAMFTVVLAVWTVVVLRPSARASSASPVSLYFADALRAPPRIAKIPTPPTPVSTASSAVSLMSSTVPLSARSTTLVRSSLEYHCYRL